MKTLEQRNDRALEDRKNLTGISYSIVILVPKMAEKYVLADRFWIHNSFTK
jgi:hypothetical protein